LALDVFVECDTIDDLYFDRPYYLAPSDAISEKAFAVICEGMREKKVAGLARTVLFRRVRTLLLRPYRAGMIATTLNFDYEIRSPRGAFADIPDRKIKGEMLDLARHIIETKRGKFDPSTFEDRYEAALAELVRAKLEGKPIEARKPEPASNVVDLMEALRRSAARAGSAGKTQARSSGTKRSGKPRKPSPKPSRRVSQRAAATRRKAG